MLNVFKLVALVFFAFFLHFGLSAQKPNVIIKCSETTTDYLLNSKNKLKSMSHFEVSKKDRSDKKIRSKVWYNTEGCATKSFYFSPGNSFGGTYAMTISEFNSKGYRTKFEQYKFDKDSVPVLTFSENVVFDTFFRLLEKKTQQYKTKNSTKYIIENYNYEDPDFKIILSRSTYEKGGLTSSKYKYIYENGGLTISIYKYISSSSETPEVREISNYTNPENYTTNIYVKDKYNEFKTVKNGILTIHQKNNFEKTSNGHTGKSTLMDMLTSKKIQETISHSEHEYTVINYDKLGNKISEYTDHIPYGLPPDSKEDFVLEKLKNYQSSFKNDTIRLKSGNKKVIIYENNSAENKNKISQTIEYNSKMLKIKQDIEALETFSEFQYEYYNGK